MEKTRLGDSALAVSRLTVGCWSFGGEAGSYWGAQDQKDVDSLVSLALEKDINFFDTAFGYNSGKSEISLGKALKGKRKSAVICNKIPIQEKEKLGIYEQTLRDSLTRLDTDYIDLMMIHWPVNDGDLIKANLEELLKAKRQGIIRAIGVSNFGVKTLELAKEIGAVPAANEFGYNLMCRGMEKGILPYCGRNNIGVLAYMPLMQGILSGKFPTIADIPNMRKRTVHFSKSGNPENVHGGPGADAEVGHLLDGMRGLSKETGISVSALAIAWLCHKEGVASVIAGCRDAGQLEENARAVETKLSADTVAALDDLSKPLFDKVGDCLDMFRGPANSRVW